MVREKIRATQLVHRLESHVFGEVEMTSTQVTAALGLLKKCVADMTEQKMELDAGGGLIDLLAGLGRGSKADDPKVA